MKKIRNISIALLLMTNYIAMGQKKINEAEIINIFQKDLANGIDLTSFNKILDQSERKHEIDAFINVMRAKGMLAQISAVKQIDRAKKEQQMFSNPEILEILFRNYKSEIPELKELYLDYLKKEYSI